METFNKLLQAKINEMQKIGKLYITEINSKVLWKTYLESFDKDPIFRDPESSIHNCNLCSNFIRRYSNIVTIDKNYNIVSLWDLEIERVSKELQPVVSAMRDHIHKSRIKQPFWESFDYLNQVTLLNPKKDDKVFLLNPIKNIKRYTKEEAEKFGVVKPNEIRTFHHLGISVNKEYISISDKTSQISYTRTSKELLNRGMKEISRDTLELIVDLIDQNSLLNGDTYKSSVVEFLKLKTLFDKIGNNEQKQSNWCWTSAEKNVSRFKNTLIGTLAVDLTQGKDINIACKEFNIRIDPANYMKASSPITKTQKKMAQKFIEENGYVQSFNRRFATIDDIKTTEIRHINIEDTVQQISIFDKIQTQTKSKSRHFKNKFDGIEQVPINRFMKEILPRCTSVEAYLKNQLESNMVTITTSNEETSKAIFKWDNNYSWTYNGNLSGRSEIKQKVKELGGNVEGVLNVRLAWNFNGQDGTDLDLWATEVGGTSIGFSTDFRKDKTRPLRTPCSGQLDVDIISPGGELAVENITWTDLNKMKNGTYKIWVNVYSTYNPQNEFKVEIETREETRLFHYKGNFKTSSNINVANIYLKDGVFMIEDIIESTNKTKTIYGLESNRFHKVNLISLSPNYWNENKVGNKHYFFMLEKAEVPVDIRGFHNDNLRSELLQHRKVLDVLGNITKISKDGNTKQLSGLGFNSTVKNELILKLKGNFQRTIKVTF